MGEFSCYCAICSCSLNRCELGSSDPDALKRRRAHVARRVFWRSKGLGYYYDTEEEENDPDVREERLRCTQAADESLEQASEDGGSNKGRKSSEEELYSYDPGLLCEEDSDWLRSIAGLGIYRDHPQGQSYFIASVDYDDCELATISNIESDPDIPEDGSKCICYYSYDSEERPVFPFHWSCFELLSRAINPGSGVEDLDKRVLYEVMSKINQLGSLELPCGDIHGNDQDWVCIPGEEYTVMDPLASSAFQLSALTEHCPLEDIDSSASGKGNSPPLTSRIITDPFSTLPAELTSMILSHINGPSLFALRQASMAIRNETQSQRFWQRKIHDDMPWLWELSSHDTQSIDFRKAYLYLDEKTRPRYGMNDRNWLALANRRRIWRACEFLTEKYSTQLENESEEKGL